MPVHAIPESRAPQAGAAAVSLMRGRSRPDASASRAGNPGLDALARQAAGSARIGQLRALQARATAHAGSARAGRHEAPAATAQRRLAAASQPEAGVVQRNVLDFNVDYEELLPPTQDLINELEASDAIDERHNGEITKQVRDFFGSKGVKTVPAPASIAATLDNQVNTPPGRNGYYSGVIGNFGRDQFYIKTGQAETFEGGHIIPHSLWDAADGAVGMADHYKNLVPMSRTLNVENWAKREDWMRDKELEDNETLEVGIDITREDYLEPTVGNMARMLKLRLDANADPTSTLRLDNWLPTKLNLDYQRVNADNGMIESEDEFSSDEEDLQNTFRPIGTYSELREALRDSPFRHRISSALWSQLNGL
ncbi:DNA/RNA non-specific endonuclease [Derxia gummosa]|uniref:DNA/RNA non-specific endonuclease n=1 Tax=Derxia gummosa DSM 723 TaxID=1121388 RepID=A0A8B6XB12_9BURK|nr:DNA/RNA non-specific endonuclease [Derxia gummosa]